MPKIIRTPRKIKKTYPMGLLTPGGKKLKKEYQSMDMMKKMRKYYRRKGYKFLNI